MTGAAPGSDAGPGRDPAPEAPPLERSGTTRAADLRRASLSRLLLRVLIVAIAGAFALLLALAHVQAGRQADLTYDRILRSAALAMLDRLEIRTAPGTPDRIGIDMPAAAFDTLAFAPDDRVFYVLRDAGGATITGNADLPPVEGRADTAQGSQGDLSPSPPPDITTREWSGEPVRMLTQSRILLTDGGARRVTLQLAQTRRARDADARAAFGLSVLGLGLVAALGLALVPLAGRRVLTPLRRLGADLERRRPTDLSPVAGPFPQETAELVASLNGFIGRLAGAQSRSEHFIADVAHQIRTGINAQQAQLQLAEDATDEAELRVRLARAQAQSLRTMRLTNQLLSHAMVIHRAEAQPRTPVDLRALVRELLAETLSQQRFARIALSLEDQLPTPAPRIAGDPVSLRECLRNILENAVAHVGPKVALTVTLRPGEDARMLCLEIADDGPGLAPEDRARMLRRFEGSPGGSGLGLAIVAEVMKAHGGQVQLADAPGGGLAVRLCFVPMAEGHAAEGSGAEGSGTKDLGAKGPTRRGTLSLGLGALAMGSCWAGVGSPGLIGAARAGTGGAGRRLTLWSATDTDSFSPILAEFATAHPGIEITYRERATQDLHDALLDPSADGAPDLVISLALDLQVDLVNRGLARPVPEAGADLRSLTPAGQTPLSWRDELFGFTLEPEVVVINRAAFARLHRPRSHADLAALIRDNPDLFAGRLGTYDIRRSGIGYLLSAEAAELGPDHARLTELMGRAGTRLYETSSALFGAVARGEIVMATGVLGSYAEALQGADPRGEAVLLDDYNLALPRTAFVHRDAANPGDAARLLRFLLSPEGQMRLRRTPGMTPLAGPDWLTARHRSSLRRLQPGPGMLLWQDPMKRRDHLAGWAAAMRAD